MPLQGGPEEDGYRALRPSEGFCCAMVTGRTTLVTSLVMISEPYEREE